MNDLKSLATVSSACRRVFLAGNTGLVGRAIGRQIGPPDSTSVLAPDHSELDLLDSLSLKNFLIDNAIEEMYFAAGRVGGIYANNTFPADFIYQNLQLAINCISCAHEAGVQKLLYLGSSCLYPRAAEQPMSESAMLSGPLEPTNEPYAVAKIAGIKLCESFNRQYGRDYRCVVPTNLYGPGDNFTRETSHVIPALMRRFDEAVQQNADEVVIWGSGDPLREFMHVDDMAAACVHIMQLPREQLDAVTSPMQSHINIGTGVDCSIRELAETMARVVGFQGVLRFDASYPDGMPRKLLDVGRLKQLGWSATIGLEEGLRETYRWYVANRDTVRGR